MRNIEDIRRLFEECVEEVRSAGIPIENVSGNVTVSQRAEKRHAGYFRDSGDIQISKHLLADGIPEKMLKQTLCHEILHGCRNASGHGPVWTSYAIKDKDIKEDPEAYKDLKPYGKGITLKTRYIDTDKIKADNKLPEDAWCCFIMTKDDRMSEYMFLWTEDGVDKEAHITVDPELYIGTAEAKVQLYRYEELAYSRKGYRLQDYIHSRYRTIQNCGFHKLSRTDAARALSMCGGDPGNTEDVFYHEWW